MSFAIFRAAASNGATNLKNALNATLLKTTGSRYAPRLGKVLINWGSSNDEAKRLARLTQGSHFLNMPEAIHVAANKRLCLEKLAEEHVATVPWYTSLAAALGHAEHGRIYARTKLTGCSGEGIRLIMSTEDPQYEEASEDGFPFPVDTVGNNLDRTYANTQLFTVGITGKRQEWRIHVVDGSVILSQLKMRREGFNDLEGYTSLVRNVETGWIYSVNFDQAAYTQLDAVKRLAVEAVGALGLDFGAVDIVEKRGEPYVLEVNTAPGLDDEGSALQAYVNAFITYEQGLLNREAV